MRSLLIAACLATFACASRTLPPIPAGLDVDSVPKQTVDMSAQKFEFRPAEVHVKAGTLVTLKVTATDVTHGIALADFGIDELLEPGVTKEIRFYVPAAGEHVFRCSHFCGMGHLGMKGRIIVE
jgi:heme/copper-type cytochrome/quinol oxidase subunit 2